MAFAKTINIKDNVVFVTHALPRKYCKEEWPHYNLNPLGNLGSLITIIDEKWTGGFPCPEELKPYQPELIDDKWGMINYKKLRTELIGKTLYFAGGIFACCLANTIKSLYGLARLFKNDLNFFLLEDFIWHNPYNPRPLVEYQKDSLSFDEKFPNSNDKTAYLYKFNEYFLTFSNWQMTVKKHQVNLLMHYQNKETEQYQRSVFYKHPQNRYTINLIICSLKDVYKYNGGQNIPISLEY